MKTSASTKAVISEMKAAAESQAYVFRMAQERWPAIYKMFREMLGDKFRVDDERIAIYDLGLAATAFDLQAVQNLFPAPQAKRITDWVMKLLDSKEWGEYSISEVEAYGDAFQHEVVRIGKGGDPMSAIPARLLRRWLGERVQDFELEIGGKKTGYMDPIMVSLAMDVLTPFAGTWKAIRDRSQLVEEDLPADADWEAQGLFPVGEYPDTSRSDGTVIYKDERGNVKEKWLHPKKMRRLLKKYKAEKVGTLCRVLVKGPWEGVKETRMQLTDRAVGMHANEMGVAYAMCVYTKGKPNYRLMKKVVWENLDRVEAIMMDASLSDEQRAAAFKKIANG